jgi:hypothetical protein
VHGASDVTTPDAVSLRSKLLFEFRRRDIRRPRAACDPKRQLAATYLSVLNPAFLNVSLDQAPPEPYFHDAPVARSEFPIMP